MSCFIPDFVESNQFIFSALFKVIDTFKAKGYSEELDSVIKELRELKVKANGQDTEVDFAFILVGFSEEKEIVNIQFNWVTELKGSDIKNTPEGDERAWEVIDVEKEHYAHGTYAMAFYDGIRLIINMEM